MDINKLLKKFGSQSALAKAFGVSRQAVAKWMAAGELPALRVYQARELMRKAP
jgi:DNA invertase Pin-like site-specific DNA recombinase